MEAWARLRAMRQCIGAAFDLSFPMGKMPDCLTHKCPLLLPVMLTNEVRKYPQHFGCLIVKTTCWLHAAKHFAPNDVPIPGRIRFGFVDCTIDRLNDI